MQKKCYTLGSCTVFDCIVDLSFVLHAFPSIYQLEDLDANIISPNNTYPELTCGYNNVISLGSYH